MNIINQMSYAIKNIFMNYRAIVTKMLTFIVIILILGSAFSDAFEPTSLDMIKVVYCIDDSGKAGKQFMDGVKGVESINELIEFVQVPTFEEAELLIDNEEAEAFVYLPENFSKQAEDKESSSVIEVYQRTYSGINQTVVESVMESFINGVNAASAIYEMQGSLEGFEFSEAAGLQKEPLTAAGKAPTSMGYYAVAMLLMMLLYGADYGCSGIADDYLGVLGERIRISPIRPYQQYIGKILGLSLVSFLQGIIVITFTKVVYNVDWGDNYLLILLIILSFSILTTTMGAMLCILTGDEKKGSSLVMVTIIGFTFLAGGFAKMDLSGIEKISPSYYAKTAILNTIYNGDMNMVYQCLGVIWCITLVLALISVAAAGRKRA